MILSNIMQNYPNITSLSQLTTYAKEIIGASLNSPFDDHIYFFPELISEMTLKDVPVESTFDNWIIAGSQPLKMIELSLCTWKNGKRGRHWESSDTNMFFLCSEAHTTKMSNLEFIYTPFGTVEELLLSFDLPCCRVAYNPKFGTWISAHTITALFTGIYYLSKNMESLDKFVQTVKKYRQYNDIPPEELSEYARKLENSGNLTTLNLELEVAKYRHERINEPFVMLGQRFFDRIEKYKSRGYTAIYLDTDVIPSWVTTPFVYEV